MKPRAIGTIAVHTELAITEKLAPSLRVTTDSKAPKPWSPIDSTSRPRWVRSLGRPAQVDGGEETHHDDGERSPQRRGAPPHAAAEQHSGRHPDRRHEGQHPADVGAPDRHAVDEDRHDQHGEGDARSRRASPAKPLRQQPAEQERGPGELPVGEVAHSREPPPDRR